MISTLFQLQSAEGKENNSKKKKKINISISGWYGNKNCGDEAILASMISTLKEENKNIEIIVFSSDPAFTTRIHHVKAVPQLSFGILSIGSMLLGKSNFQAIKAFWKTDLFILGGGGFLSDWQGCWVITQWLGQLAIAKIFRKRTMLYGVGAGPISTWVGKFFTRTLINRYADKITVRDISSKECLQKAGVTNEIVVTADPAIRLKPVETYRIDEILRNESINIIKPSVGLSIPLVFHDPKYWPNHQRKFQKFQSVFPEVIDSIISELDSDVVIIPMQIPMDRNFAFDLMEYIKHKDRVKIIQGEYTPNEIMGIIGRMDLMIGMRLHSLILAAVMDTPMIGIMYHCKVECFLEQTEQKNWAVGIGEGEYRNNEDINTKELIEKLRLLWVYRKEQRREIKDKVTSIIKKETLNNNIAINLLMDVK